MTAMVLAMIGTLAIGFMAGREYDRGIKRVKANQRRRREEAERRERTLCSAKEQLRPPAKMIICLM